MQPQQPDPGQPPQQPYYPPPQVHYVTAPVRRTSTLAVIGLTLSILGALGGWCMCGIPNIAGGAIGIFAYQETKTEEVAGKGMAVASMVLGALFGLPFLIFGLFFGGMSMIGSAIDSHPTPSPSISATP